MIIAMIDKIICCLDNERKLLVVRVGALTPVTLKKENGWETA